MNKEELAYIAGIVDGEGTIFISKAGGLSLVIGMTHEPTIDWLSVKLLLRKKLFKRPEYPNHKDSYQLTAFGKRAKYIIESIAPYLITKKEHAKWALNYPLLNQGQHEVDESVLQLRNAIYVVMKGLNKKGRNI